MAMKEIPAQCARCRHLHEDLVQIGVAGAQEQDYAYACDAFLDGIPDGIASADHRKPFEGDHGIRWEPLKPGLKHPMDE